MFNLPMQEPFPEQPKRREQLIFWQLFPVYPEEHVQLFGPEKD